MYNNVNVNAERNVDNQFSFHPSFEVQHVTYPAIGCIGRRPQSRLPSKAQRGSDRAMGSYLGGGTPPTVIPLTQDVILLLLLLIHRLPHSVHLWRSRFISSSLWSSRGR